MLAFELPAVTAMVSRASNGTDALAAIGIALSVIYVVNVPGLSITSLIATDPSRVHSKSLLIYSAVTGVIGCLLLISIGLVSKFGNNLPLFISSSTGIGRSFQLCVISLSTIPLAVSIRRYFHGLLISSGKTKPIALSAVVRISSSAAASFLLLMLDLPGALVGGLALTFGAWLETASLAVQHRSTAGPVASDAGFKLRRTVAQHLRLSSPFLLNMCPSLVTTIAISRALDADKALVLWPILVGVMSLATMPLTDLDSVVVVARRQQFSSMAIIRFVSAVGLFFFMMFGIFAVTAVGDWYIIDFSGVPNDISLLASGWIVILAVAPLLWCARGYLRSLLIQQDRSSQLPIAAAVHLSALIVAGLTLPYLDVSGVGIGVISIIGALGIEIIYVFAVMRYYAFSSRPRFV